MIDRPSGHYQFDEVSWAKQMLDIKSGSLTAKKFKRIGVNIDELHEQARKILEESSR